MDQEPNPSILLEIYWERDYRLRAWEALRVKVILWSARFRRAMTAGRIFVTQQYRVFGRPLVLGERRRIHLIGSEHGRRAADRHRPSWQVRAEMLTAAVVMLGSAAWSVWSMGDLPRLLNADPAQFWPRLVSGLMLGAALGMLLGAAKWFGECAWDAARAE